MKPIKPPTFRDLLDRLTKEGHDWVSTDAGKVLAKRQGLLPQLRTAVFAGMENTGGSSAFGSKPPLDAAAIDLLDEITDQAAQVLAIVDPHPTPFGTAEHYVRLWAAQTTETKRFTLKVKSFAPGFVYDKEHPRRNAMTYVDQEHSALELLRRWTERIEDFFNPPSSREIAAACPTCEVRYVHRLKDGQWIQVSALNILRDRTTGEPAEAKCGACGVSWAPSQFGFLAELVGATAADPIVEKAVKEKTHIESEACFTKFHDSCTSVRCQCDCHTASDTRKAQRMTTV